MKKRDEIGSSGRRVVGSSEENAISEKPQDVAAELAALELEEKRLRLTLMRQDLAEREQRARDAAKVTATREANFSQERLMQAQREANCPHRKGGLGLEGLTNGDDDSNRSLVKITYPYPWDPVLRVGGTCVMCTRCGMDMKPDDPRYAEYMRLPSKNVPVGNLLFNVTYGPTVTEEDLRAEIVRLTAELQARSSAAAVPAN